MLNFIKEKGLPMDAYIRYADNLEDVKKYIDEIKDMRFDLNYDIDGVVIAIDDIRTRELLGYTIKFPKWAIAFKFEAQEATTTLLDVEWNRFHICQYFKKRSYMLYKTLLVLTVYSTTYFLQNCFLRFRKSGMQCWTFLNKYYLLELLR